MSSVLIMFHVTENDYNGYDFRFKGAFPDAASLAEFFGSLTPEVRNHFEMLCDYGDSLVAIEYDMQKQTFNKGVTIRIHLDGGQMEFFVGELHPEEEEWFTC